MGKKEETASDMKSFDKMDRLINRALESYTAGEPEPGLVDRVLVSVARTRRGRPVRVALAWALASAAALGCIATATMWLNWRHLEIAIVHTSASLPVARAQKTPTIASTSQAKTPTGKAHAPATSGFSRENLPRLQSLKREAAADDGARSKANETDTTAEDEQLAAEGVGPIIFKPIVMAPTRLEAPGQE